MESRKGKGQKKYSVFSLSSQKKSSDQPYLLIAAFKVSPFGGGLVVAVKTLQLMEFACGGRRT